MATIKPLILAVDDDQNVLQAINRDLRKAYRNDYRILSTTSAAEALEALQEVARKNESVALLLSDQRMPEMLGVDFLEKARKLHPNARRVLLTAYSDTDAAIRAINDVQLDYYLMKPWDPPEERLYPVLNDLLDEWQAGYKPVYSGIRVMGFPFSPKSHRIKDFLAGNLIPYKWVDAQQGEEARSLMTLHSVVENELPVVLFEDGTALRDPDTRAVADKMGFQHAAQHDLYDVAIIGAGPAGLAAAVYGASEGLKTVMIEKRAPGGHAGTSSRIENYLGFPKGLSGADLTRRAITQATRFGTEFLSPQEVTSIEVRDGYKILKLADGTSLNARSAVITTGVDYRKLESTGLEQFTGAGVYYGAATTEAPNFLNKEVYIVGGGNSAGQAAMYLSKFAAHVYIVIRKEDLTSTMSAYLIDQIAGTENIELVPCSVVAEARGDTFLEELVLEDLNTQAQRTVEASALFVFIGARPYTDWLLLDIIKDKRGFLVTGQELKHYKEFLTSWKQDRDPFLLETCQPGIFAAGDVRSGAMNRVASAVGEGAMAISFVHQYLAAN